VASFATSFTSPQRPRGMREMRLSFASGLLQMGFVSSGSCKAEESGFAGGVCGAVRCGYVAHGGCYVYDSSVAASLHGGDEGAAD